MKYQFGEKLREIRERKKMTMRDVAEQAGVTLAPGASANLPPAAAHPFALRRALLNVITNALQFSPRGSAVEVAFAADAKTVTLDVLDRGPGIPPAMREKVFEAFVTGPCNRLAHAACVAVSMMTPAYSDTVGFSRTVSVRSSA